MLYNILLIIFARHICSPYMTISYLITIFPYLPYYPLDSSFTYLKSNGKFRWCAGAF